MTARTPLRQARAAALWGHLAGRAECIEDLIEARPRGWDLKDDIRHNSLMTGTFIAVNMFGTTSESKMPNDAMSEWAAFFQTMHALNVTAVIGFLTDSDNKWRKGDVEAALNDLANDEVIRLVAERESGEVGIELLRRPDDE
jgi:hypothetical protein